MKGERQERINEMLEDASKHLRALDPKSPVENDIWEAYAKLEYAILLVKLDHDLETPGGFEYNRFDKTGEEVVHLAIDYLESGKKALKRGNAKPAVDDLRKARDMLKHMLKR